MATINVRRDVQDSFYRYKMPRLTAKVNIKSKNILPYINICIG
jgi:translation initiation factor 5